MTRKICNIAIIAHIDHGKTTLIDKLLQQSGTINIRNNSNYIDKIMDYNYLEKERGITITSKNTALYWHDYRINIIDTPGHADFSGEVERIMSMVDSVLLLVDSIDGPMPQTRFVTQKAFAYGFKPIVVINKIDRFESRPDWVIEKIFDLFIDLGATDEQLDFPIIYASSLRGIAGFDLKKMANDMTPLFECIIKYVKIANLNIDEPFQMLVSQLDYCKYTGTIGIGRVTRGYIKSNQNVCIIDCHGSYRFGKINQISHYVGLQRVEIQTAESGDIVAITGINNLNISDTICSINKIEALPKLVVAKPIISILFGVNNSPFSGQEGKFITASEIWYRLKKECLNNISLKAEKTDDSNIFRISGRGELHLSILIENMRREGFELSIFKPKVISYFINNIKQEPFELVLFNIENQHQGQLMKMMDTRKGRLSNVMFNEKNRIRLEYIIPSRGLIGLRSLFLTVTSGTGIFFSSFSHYGNICKDEIKQRENGVLISNIQGQATAYALFNLQNHGRLFLNHGDKVYKGQIIGIHSRSNNLIVNCSIGKKLTNIRASNTDSFINLTPPVKMSLEQALSFINDDEIIEITPCSMRFRKQNF